MQRLFWIVLLSAALAPHIGRLGAQQATVFGQQMTPQDFEYLREQAVRLYPEASPTAKDAQQQAAFHISMVVSANLKVLEARRDRPNEKEMGVAEAFDLEFPHYPRSAFRFYTVMMLRGSGMKVEAGVVVLSVGVLR